MYNAALLQESDSNMPIEIDTRAEKADRGWRDVDGFAGPERPGRTQRANPRGAFPTGPKVGTELANIVCRDVHGKPFDFYRHRGTSPAVVIFFRSAVW